MLKRRKYGLPIRAVQKRGRKKPSKERKKGTRGMCGVYRPSNSTITQGDWSKPTS